jgi:Fe2+-dicitrate sensor, membrane component
MVQSSDRIETLAALWAAKVAGGPLTPDDQCCLDRWLAADIRHAGAFARAQAILLRMDRLRAIGGPALRASVPEVPAELVDVEVPPEVIVPDGAVERPLPQLRRLPTMNRRRALLAGSAAASFVVAGLLGAGLIRNSRSRRDVPADPVERIATRRGETRKVRLADGSVVTLNTNSIVSVHFTDKTRDIHLEYGEALFNVAKNKSRPFIVTTSDAVIRAVGTAFTVRALPERSVQVLVQEGVVEVSHRDQQTGKAIRAAAETKAVIASNAPIAVHTVPRVEVERNLAWRYGQISFENVRLADAAQEFARYSDTKIAVDPAVANHTITGMFPSNDPAGFAKAAATVLNLHVEVEANVVWIVR